MNIVFENKAAMELQRAFLSDPVRCTAEILQDLIIDLDQGGLEEGKVERSVKALYHRPLYLFAAKSLKYEVIQKLVEEQVRMEEKEDDEKREVMLKASSDLDDRILIG